MKMKIDSHVHGKASNRRLEQGIENPNQDFADPHDEMVKNSFWDEEEKEKGEESENGEEFFRGEEIIISNNNNEGYNKDMPPADDVCPICFDGFTIPCRSNCGHWFCASCFLQFWMYRSSVQPCKCPLCCSSIVNLKPETSHPIAHEDDSVDVLKKVDQYNGLHTSGMRGTFLKVLAFPVFMGRIFRVLIDPDSVRCIYYVMRLLGLLLALIYETWEFEFIPTGGFGIQRTFDMGAYVLFTTLFLIGFGHRCLLSLRARRLAAIQVWDT